MGARLLNKVNFMSNRIPNRAQAKSSSNLLQIHQLGRQAEDLACDYLSRQGLMLLERNYRCKMGEIDLVMLHDQRLIFVEVRYRKPGIFGQAVDSVTWQKQKKIFKTAQHFLCSHPQYSRSYCRFDVISVTPLSLVGLDILWLQDAFQES